jgi:Uma2 family endonuclease
MRFFDIKNIEEGKLISFARYIKKDDKLIPCTIAVLRDNIMETLTLVVTEKRCNAMNTTNLATKQEYFTYEDYLTWDDDERYELIAGEPYMMSPAPSRKHQEILGILYRKIADCLDGKPCNVYIAPIDVRLNPEGDDDTVVQPDLVVVCDESKEADQGIVGAPDLVVEILSPSTAAYDMGIKLDTYIEVGISECWLVDPEKNAVRVYVRNGGGTFKIKRYKGEDVIPVALFPELNIELKSIFK